MNLQSTQPTSLQKCHRVQHLFHPPSRDDKSGIQSGDNNKNGRSLWYGGNIFSNKICLLKVLLAFFGFNSLLTVSHAYDISTSLKRSNGKMQPVTQKWSRGLKLKKFRFWNPLQLFGEMIGKPTRKTQQNPFVNCTNLSQQKGQDEAGSFITSNGDACFMHIEWSCELLNYSTHSSSKKLIWISLRRCVYFNSEFLIGHSQSQLRKILKGNNVYFYLVVPCHLSICLSLSIIWSSACTIPASVGLLGYLIFEEQHEKGTSKIYLPTWTS